MQWGTEGMTARHLKRGGMHTTAAMQIVTHNHPQLYKTESSYEEHG